MFIESDIEFMSGIETAARNSLLIRRTIGVVVETAANVDISTGDGNTAAAERDTVAGSGLHVASQTVVGSGVWLAWGADDAASGYIMTMLVLIYLLPAMVNLAHDAVTFRISAPLLICQPALFWFLQGTDGMAMGASAMSLLVLTLSSVRTSQEQFDAAIRMRHEKNEERLAVTP